MNTKTFVLLLVGVLLLGGALGGAFVGGMAVGGSQDSEANGENQTGGSILGLQQESSDQQSVDDLRQRFQSGDVSPEDMAQLRQKFQGQGGMGPGGADIGGVGFAGPTGLTGTIESVEGNTVTVNTSQGVLHVTVGEDTTIQETVEVSPADLLVGMRVTINGALGEGGTVEATTVVVIPE